MREPTRTVFGSTTIDPTSPSLFSKNVAEVISKDEVRLNPPRDRVAEIQSAMQIIDSGRSLFLEMAFQTAKCR